MPQERPHRKRDGRECMRWETLITNGPAMPPTNCTHIRTVPFLTSQPSLAANFGSTKVVDAPVSSRNLGEGAGKELSVGTGTKMERRGWKRAYVMSPVPSSAEGMVWANIKYAKVALPAVSSVSSWLALGTVAHV
ncbi:hypothetical protein C370_04556 [Cryptococcus neoformans A1-35-8]|nr:hypothetical protein C370_04556 [Cryptococcus neoformans var. grubii A1-35-8]